MNPEAGGPNSMQYRPQRKEKSKRPPCVVCGEEQVDVSYLPPVEVPKKDGDQVTFLKFYIGFPVCYQHEVDDLPPDQHVFQYVIVEIA